MNKYFIIVLLCLSLILLNIINKYKIFIKLSEILKNDDEIKLYMKDKIQFFINKRTKYLKQNNIDYNESSLVTFQDKLNYLIIHESPEYKSNLVDKIKLHQYSKKIIGKDICVPILKIYDDANEIDFDELPNQFVLKLNHGSAMNILYFYD